jgi:hypothetical protein
MPMIDMIRRRLGQGREMALGEMARLAGLPVRHHGTCRHAIEDWLRDLRSAQPARDRIAILALRNITWIDWAVYAACVLRSLGHAATIYYSAADVRRVHGNPISHFNLWDAVPRIPDIELVDLDKERSATPPEWLEETAQVWSTAGVAYDLGLEEEEVRASRAKFSDELGAYVRRSVRLGHALHHHLSVRDDIDRLIVYSGLIDCTPTLLEVGRRCHLPTVCVEGWAWRAGHMIYNLDAPALEYNVVGWLKSFGTWSADQCQSVKDYLNFVDGGGAQAAWLDSFQRIQQAVKDARIPPHVESFCRGGSPIFLAAPNVIGDSSLFRRETIFRSQRVWLESLMADFRNHPDRKLIVRVHPAELWVGGKCRSPVGPIARNLASGLANVLVVDAHEKCNTFALAPFIRAGLAWVSTAGPELTARGIPVICGAKPKYSGMGICAEPASREEFFALLGRHAAGVEPPSEAQRVRAMQYLYLVFKGFSFDAFSPTYTARGCRMHGRALQAEHDRFYRIIAGDEPMPDQLAAQ